MFIENKKTYRDQCFYDICASRRFGTLLAQMCFNSALINFLIVVSGVIGSRNITQFFIVGFHLWKPFTIFICAKTAQIAENVVLTTGRSGCPKIQR